MNKTATFTIAMLMLASPAMAETGVLSGSGEGEDSASACQSAKSDIEVRFGLAKQIHGGSGAITHFEPCDCAVRPNMLIDPAEQHRAWKCTTNADYKTDE